MKKRILLGSIFTVFILLALPSVQAVESDSLQEISKKIQNLQIDENLRSRIINSIEKIENIDSKNLELIIKIDNLLDRIENVNDLSDTYLEYAMTFFLLGLLFSFSRFDSLANLYFRLSVLYLVLYIFSA